MLSTNINFKNNSFKMFSNNQYSLSSNNTFLAKNNFLCKKLFPFKNVFFQKVFAIRSGYHQIKTFSSRPPLPSILYRHKMKTRPWPRPKCNQVRLRSLIKENVYYTYLLLVHNYPQLNKIHSSIDITSFTFYEWKCQNKQDHNIIESVLCAFSCYEMQFDRFSWKCRKL